MDDITDSMDMSLSKLQETVKDREAWQAVFHGVTKSQTWLSVSNTNILMGALYPCWPPGEPDRQLDRYRGMVDHS